LRKSLPEQGMPVRIIELALACDSPQYTYIQLFVRYHVLMRIVSLFCSIGIEGLRRYVDTHLHCSSAAPIGLKNVTVLWVLGLGGSSLRFDLPRRSAGRSFLGLNEAEQQSFARHRVSCASWSASQCCIQ
jgi:hypothetical protein